MESEERIKQELLDITEVSRILKFSVSRVRYEIQTGRLPYIKIGRSIRFDRNSIEKWIKSHGVRNEPQ